LAIQEKLAAEFPSVPEYRSDLARSHNNLGLLLKARGQRTEAEEQSRKGLAIREKLAAEFPSVPEYRSDLAWSHTNLGVLFSDRGQRTEAEEQYRKGLAIREKLAAEFPGVPEYRVSLGGSYCNFGQLISDGGQSGESLDWFGKAIKTLGPIHEGDPRAVTPKIFLRNSYWNRAVSHERLGRFAEGVKDLDKAVELSPKEERLFLQALRATAKLNAGQVTEAVAEVAELRKRMGWDAKQLYDFACVYAVASRQIMGKMPEYADVAIELLTKAVKAGYLDVAQVKKDTNLDPLREREDFKKLIAEWEAKVKK
jgi:tetratricopeptide (TPR) repeat protein